jgi:arylsulfatase A-like enzyme
MLAMLSAMDDAIGQVMERVRAAGQEDNTLVFFLSDNGGPTHGNGSRNDPFSGFKNNVREGGIRVPFAVQWKGASPAGKTYEKPVSSLDIFPTVLAASGAKQPEKQSTDGVDLVPFVTGKKVTTRARTTRSTGATARSRPSATATRSSPTPRRGRASCLICRRTPRSRPTCLRRSRTCSRSFRRSTTRGPHR